MPSESDDNQRENIETSSFAPSQNSIKSTTSGFENSDSNTSPVDMPSSSNVTPVGSTKLADDDTPAVETITEISTSISLIKTELTLKESGLESHAFTAERRNTFADSENAGINDSTQPYERTPHLNASTTQIPSLPPEIEAILNITKKKEEGEFELDYDEPTLPPSLPNLK